MSEAGDKTEQPTPRRLEEAYKHGQFAHSGEVQTVFVLLAAVSALVFTSRDLWRQMAATMAGMLSHLHTIPLNRDVLQGYLITSALVAARCVGPIVVATALAALLAGAVQNRFHTSPEALEPNWERVNPVEGFKRVFTFRSAIPGLLGVVRLAVIVGLSYSAIRKVIEDPIFYTTVDVARVSQFLARATASILLRISGAMVVLAAADYGYQY